MDRGRRRLSPHPQRLREPFSSRGRSFTCTIAWRYISRIVLSAAAVNPRAAVLERIQKSGDAVLSLKRVIGVAVIPGTSLIEVSMSSDSAFESAVLVNAVVDAFMAAARNGEFDRLLRLLAPDATVGADAAAVGAGTPQRLEGRDEVATFFNGSARSALPVFVQGRAGSAWFHLGEARVVFDFTVADGLVHAITFRAAPEVLAAVVRRDGPAPRP